MSDRVRLVVFDLGGVIVRICRSWPEACLAAGVPVRPGWDDPAAKAARRDLNKAYQEGRMRCEEFFERLGATAPGLYTTDEVRRVHDAWMLVEYPGAGGLVERLHAAGVGTGVLSNTNHSHWARLAPPAGVEAPEYPTPRMVRHLYASHLMGMSKPDEAIYREFARRTGTDPRGILFFDDLEENVAAARAAGWVAHQVDHAGDTVGEMTAVLESMGVFGSG